MNVWNPSSWTTKVPLQQPNYDDTNELESVVKSLSQLPPLVTSWEIERLKNQLALASTGSAFLLQGGDCNETFRSCRPDPIEKQLKVLLQMSLVLVYGMRKPVIRVGRIAGQYAKPRSSPTETRGGLTLPSYRGDCVNQTDFNAEARTARPQRLLTAYEKSVQTLNYLRALAEGGFADIQHPENWELDFVGHSNHSADYHSMVQGIDEALRFLDTIGGVTRADLSRIDFYTSHEGLILPYEQALTRQALSGNGWYNLGTHYPWIGDRTRDLHGSHVEYFRGIQNPIGVKVGPGAAPDEITELLDRLNPDHEVGRITLICRFGVDKIRNALPPLIRSIRASGHPVLWSVDPMHGNTITTTQGLKTRHFDSILDEVRQSFAIHREHGTIVGGIHLELTGHNVTECIGGSSGLCSTDLSKAYESNVDPRLNYEQAMEIAFLIAGHSRTG